MLTSSDAKWRCMWHMLVWSILLTLVSQYLAILDHVALYIFAGLCMVILPSFTAIYSNTSGRRGAGLIRVAYVVCDPVLASITITPVLVLNHLPGVVTQYNCLVRHDDWNLTCDCVQNRSVSPDPRFTHVPEQDKQQLLQQVLSRFMSIQIAVAVPILLSLLMGRRTGKMSRNTYILAFAYWFITAIELVDMIETIRLGDIYNNVIFTTGTIITITMIITNSYAVVTLCSFISPQVDTRDKKNSKRFDLVYKIFIGAAAVVFTEIPLIIARFQMLSADMSRILPATFYLWGTKDLLFLCLIIFIILTQKFGKKSMMKLPCKVKFDNPDVFFQPEKRDEYIISKKKVTFMDPPATTFGETNKRKLNNELQKPDVSSSGTSSPDAAKKVPNSVLKKSPAVTSGSLSVHPDRPVGCTSNTGQLTDLSSRKSNSGSENSVTSSRPISEQLEDSSPPGLPMTQLFGTPKDTWAGSGVRPKVHNGIREIKSRPAAVGDGHYSSSDTDSLV